ncbi:MAG: peptide-methionine (S)-S-oxide reductase MsrA [Mariprofundaceae bacterium]
MMGVFMSVPAQAENQLATFGGGCFWCMQPPFDHLQGVLKTSVGYTGGDVKNPTYAQVSAGGSGHVEVIRVEYDSSVVDYSTLLQTFWENIDPTQEDGQFADRGSQYRTVIFYHDLLQKEQAEKSKQALSESAKFASPIVVTIEPLREYYQAEDYHQQYYQKNEEHYQGYKRGSGRAGFIEKNWK